MTSRQKRNLSPIRIVGQVGRRRDFFNAVNRKTNLQLTTTTDIAEERRREERREGEVEVCRGFPTESEKGTPLGSAAGAREGATLTGVKRSPFSADYFARGALFLLPPFSTFQRPEECRLIRSLICFPTPTSPEPLT